LCSFVLTCISKQLNAAMSTPTECNPLSSACTSVVPEPANGSTHPPARRHVPAEELLDELRDVLAEIRMEPMDMLRPHPLR